MIDTQSSSKSGVSSKAKLHFWIWTRFSDFPNPIVGGSKYPFYFGKAADGDKVAWAILPHLKSHPETSWGSDLAYNSRQRIDKPSVLKTLAITVPVVIPLLNWTIA